MINVPVYNQLYTPSIISLEIISEIAYIIKWSIYQRCIFSSNIYTKNLNNKCSSSRVYFLISDFTADNICCLCWKEPLICFSCCCQKGVNSCTSSYNSLHSKIMDINECECRHVTKMNFWMHKHRYTYISSDSLN